MSTRKLSAHAGAYGQLQSKSEGSLIIIYNIYKLDRITVCESCVLSFMFADPSDFACETTRTARSTEESALTKKHPRQEPEPGGRVGISCFEFTVPIEALNDINV